ncbi:MAG: S49 family peptidase [Micropruina sp.]|uniref:S49 family peptidase n=1 Tax=Micropruina sp. TaxID=2737536 RepID=UPI0039E360B7
MTSTPDQSPTPASHEGAAPMPAQQPPTVPQPQLQPVFAPPPPPRERSFRRGFGLGAGAGLGAGGMLLVLGIVGSLVTALIYGAALAAVASNTAGPRIAGLETVWGASSATPAQTVLAIPIEGPIMADGGDGFALTTSTLGYEIARTLDELKSEDAAGVVLLMNTPGGTINGSRAIADAVERYQSRTGKKVVAYVRGMSASGGMYAMAGADKIIADHGSLIGSIGVIFGPFVRYKNVVGTSGSIVESGVTTTGGITQEYLTQGTGKDFGNPFRDMTPQERERMMAGLANEYDAFVDWVSKQRGIPAATIKDDLGAYIYDGRTAIAKKLIDAQLGPDEAFRDAVQLMGLDAATARVAQRKAATALEQLLGASSRIYGYQVVAPQGTRASSLICAGAPQPLLWHGPVTAICG